MTSPTVTREPHDTLRNAIAPWIHPGATWIDIAKAANRHLSQPVDRGDSGELIRSLTQNATIGDLLGIEVAAIIQKSAAPDTTKGWALEVPASNFKESQLFIRHAGERFGVVPPGGQAEPGSLSFSQTGRKIARFARTLEIDEMEMINGQSLGPFLFDAAQFAVMASRVRPDLVYAVVLENAAMQYDSVALFHADHANLGTAAMGTAGLSAGIAAIGNQVATGEDGKPVHHNNAAGILVVPPDLVEVARRTVRNTTLADGNDIVVRQESRLGAAGLVDPVTEQVRTGSTTNWLLAARTPVVPSIAVLALNGEFTPTVRKWAQQAGRWGLSFDISLDLAAVAIDHQGAYWSTGGG